MRPPFALAGLAAAALLAAGAQPASALALDPREIALSVESTLIDFDTAMIAIHHGPDPASRLAYVSRIDEAGWAGRLFGDYGGREVDIYYTGALAPLGGDSYAISYASEWRLDGATGAGSGSAVYTDPDFDFDIDFVNREVSGAISVSYGVASLTLSGTKNVSTAELTVSGTASAFDLPLIGAAADASLSFTYDQSTGRYVSGIEVNVLGGWLYSATKQINAGGIVRPPVGETTPPPDKYPSAPPVQPYPAGGAPGGFDPAGGAAFNNGVVSTVPAPPALILLGAAAAGLAALRRRGPAHVAA